jgi:uncharacterized protein YuzE
MAPQLKVGRFLIRVIIEQDRDPPEAVTAYRTRHVQKYWRTMRIDYDEDHDTVCFRLQEQPKTVESDEIEPGVIVDYGPSGEVVDFELLDARRPAEGAAAGVNSRPGAGAGTARCRLLGA